MIYDHRINLPEQANEGKHDMIHCSSEALLKIMEMAKGGHVFKSQKWELDFLLGLLIMLIRLLLLLP